MDERVWMITGSSSGFGRAIADAVLARGERVVATARRVESLADLAEHERVHVAALDVTDAGQRAAAVEEAMQHFGRIDVLVNNAGRTQVGAIEETTDEELRFLFELYFFAPAAFRTGLFRPDAAYLSAELPEYADTVGPTRDYVREGDGTQAGDPAKAAEAILTALERLSGELASWRDVGAATAMTSAR